MPFVAIWKFTVAADKVPEFVRAYGPDGVWAGLFRRAEGFLSTRLVQDRGDGGIFVTIDCWASQASYAAFRETFADDYAAIDRRCEALTVAEVCVAQGESLPNGAAERLRQPTGEQSC
jgi:heme-degrading monooxygenase HmoA